MSGEIPRPESLRPLEPAAPAATRPTAEFSPLQRRDEFDAQQVWVYRFDASGWMLRAVSSRGASAVWRQRFATDAEALAEYKRTVVAHGGGFIVQAGDQVRGMDGLKPDLLQPQDVRYRGAATLRPTPCLPSDCCARTLA